MSGPENTTRQRPGRPALVRYLARLDDGALMRGAFIGVLLGAATLVGLDLRELADANGGLLPAAKPESLQHRFPVLPPAVKADPDRQQSNDPRRFVTAEEDILRQPISFTLGADGLLQATGSIDPGSASRLRAELDARGEYVKRVSLNSPGGALDDAILMAGMLRERGVSTVVEDGAICASSCPLLLAGGKTREVGGQAAVGLHQFYTVTDAAVAPAQAMADAQMTTARISRHLQEMGVDPAIWLHALDTPPRALYYLTTEEMKRYRLVTEAEKIAKQ
ncbi:hypothetical protein [Chelativorans sp. AA-79]|uniref:COG3904 family protein n=1 Tax=Chelativorans sp. AA-79 TaxID=3028735 RepID=UPI0023F688D2|nr:hypothetical protein [Chelativorans sp. AA-79]WEX09949.1 hypothetical protein PVE73_02985 [Chelativorans sp. AA-79]